MSSLVPLIIKLKALEFNKKREFLSPQGSYAWLLEKAGMTGDFTRTFIITDWFYNFNDFRNKIHIHVATNETPFISALNQATDVTVNGYVYEIDKRDIVPPDGKRPWWQFYGSKTIDTFTEEDLP